MVLLNKKRTVYYFNRRQTEPKMSKISVIIPVYNSEKYLQKCICSITHQTYKDIEIIFIDDGSTDNSLTILNDYSLNDNRIKVLTQKNQGSAIARANGIAHTTGDYITFIDSDDYVTPTFIETLYSTLFKADADISVCDYFIDKNNCIYEKNNITCYKIVEKTNEKNCCSVLKTISPCLWNKMFKKDLLPKFYNYISNDLTIAEDVSFVFSAFAVANRIVMTPQKLYYYRQHNESTSNTYKNYWEDYSKFFNSVLLFNKEKNLNIEQDVHGCFGTYYITTSLKTAFTENNKKLIFQILNSDYIKLYCKNFKTDKIKTKLFILLLKLKRPLLLKVIIRLFRK